jgi:uncharacterized protein YjbI with pentapeptide repeats
MTETASNPTSQMDGATPARPTTDDREAWSAYWQAQGMSWRTEPEISGARQAYLAERRAITPDIGQGIYPFKGVEPKLTRADIERLLVTHESRGVVGPVSWDEEKDAAEDTRRVGLDLRGAELQRVNLSLLPLAMLRGGLTFEEAPRTPEARREQAQIHLERTSLESTHLEGATLAGANLNGAKLHDARLEEANLYRAQLAQASLRRAQLDRAYLWEAQLEGASLREAQLAGANLSNAQLAGANLTQAQLAGANLGAARLEKADLTEAQLEGAHLDGAWLEKANLTRAQLEGASLLMARLKGANLEQAMLESANLSLAHLEETSLDGVQLEGANLSEARLTGATLTAASFDKATTLNDAILTEVSLDQAIFDNTNLSVVNWQNVPVLGDELTAQKAKTARRRRKSRVDYVRDYMAAARAYRRLAAALQANGMSEEADGYRYRAQIMQRRQSWYGLRLGRYLFSLILAVLAGYGYKPGRSVAAYLLVIAAFAGLFLLAGLGIVTFGLPPSEYQSLPWYEALVLSVASFHGRGFFQPVQSPGDPIAILAAIEAVFGLFIEVAFIATFTQRFFGK